MPPAKKDRIRISLNVDTEIYKLIKCWSRLEGKPISRLFDEVFAPHVEAWKALCMDQIPDDTEAMKKSKKAKKRRRIEALKLSIESDIESIRKTQSKLDELGVDDVGSDHEPIGIGLDVDAFSYVFFWAGIFDF